MFEQNKFGDTSLALLQRFADAKNGFQTKRKCPFHFAAHCFTRFEIDRATFRVMGNEVLLDIARTAPKTARELSTMKGMPRGVLERGASAILAAITRGLEVAEEHLPKFPRAPKWDREEDFDERVAKLKSVRDAAATRLSLDPGVLCSRERLESIARKRPEKLSDLEDIPGLRRWQVGEMGDEFIRVLKA